MGGSDDGPVVVADAGPLIHLDELEVVQVLEDFSEVCIPDAVWGEVERHRPGACSKLDRSRTRRLEPIQEMAATLTQWAKILALGVAGERSRLCTGWES